MKTVFNVFPAYFLRHNLLFTAQYSTSDWWQAEKKLNFWWKQWHVEHASRLEFFYIPSSYAKVLGGKIEWKQWPASLSSTTTCGARKPPGPKYYYITSDHRIT